MNQEEIKKALDNFENDKFSDAKDILTREIRSCRDEFLNDKLGLAEEQENEEELDENAAEDAEKQRQLKIMRRQGGDDSLPGPKPKSPAEKARIQREQERLKKERQAKRDRERDREHARDMGE